MFFSTEAKDILKIVEKIETDVKEIKETNQFILPESIRYEFHFTYSTNIFTFIKRMQTMEMAETHNLKNCVKHLAELKSQLDVAKKTNDKQLCKTIGDSIRSEELQKNDVLKNISECRKQYYDLDMHFNLEIRYHMKRVNKWFITRMICCDWLKS